MFYTIHVKKILPGGSLGFCAFTAAEAKAQFLIQQHKIENRITPMNKTMSKAINAAKLGSSDSTKLVDSSVVAAGIIFWIPKKNK